MTRNSTKFLSVLGTEQSQLKPELSRDVIFVRLFIHYNTNTADKKITIIGWLNHAQEDPLLAQLIRISVLRLEICDRFEVLVAI